MRILIRIRLFTLMLILILLLLLIYLIQNCDRWSGNASVVSVDGHTRLQFEPLKLLNFVFNVDPDPAFLSNADPDPAFQNNADPDPQPCIIILACPLPHSFFFFFYPRQHSFDLYCSYMTLYGTAFSLIVTKIELDWFPNRGHLAVEDYDRVIEEFERAKALYGNSEETLFHTYLAEAATG